MAEHPDLFMLTLAQAIALYRVYERTPIFYHPIEMEMQIKSEPSFSDQQPMTFEEFAKHAELGSDCIMVPWCGMWLGIEKNGYTHS